MTARARYFQGLRDDYIGPNFTVRVRFKQRTVEACPTPWDTPASQDIDSRSDELAVLEVRVNVFASNVPRARDIASRRVISQAPDGKERKAYNAQVISHARSMCQLKPEVPPKRWPE